MKSTLIEKHDLDRYLKIRELVKDYPNDMEFGSLVRELFWERDTAGYPVKKIDKWLSRDIDKAVMIDNICSHGNDLNSNCQECDEEQMKDIWICGICNESTYEVDYDYIGTNTNHLGCELKIELKDRSREKKISNAKDNDADYYTGPDGHYEKYGDILHKLSDE